MYPSPIKMNMENKLATDNHQIHLVISIPRIRRVIPVIAVLLILLFASLGPALAFSTKLRSEGDAEYAKQNYTAALLKYEAAKSWWLPEKISPKLQNGSLHTKIDETEIMIKSAENYTKGMEAFDKKQYPEAKGLLSSLDLKDPHYQTAKDTLESIEKVEEALSKPTDTPTVKQTSKNGFVSKVIPNDQVVVPTPLPTPTKAPAAPSTDQFRSQIVSGISQYNDAVKQIKEQKLKICGDETDKINQKYKPQLDNLTAQIADLEKQKKEACPYDNPYSEACMVGSIRNQVDSLNRQILTLQGQEAALSQEQTNELNSIRTTFCGLPAIQSQPMPLPDYLSNQSKLPTYFHIQPDGFGGYTIYDNNSLYLRVSPDGVGGYTVY